VTTLHSAVPRMLILLLLWRCMLMLLQLQGLEV
jgi:hypothetical protein